MDSFVVMVFIVIIGAVSVGATMGWIMRLTDSESKNSANIEVESLDYQKTEPDINHDSKIEAVKQQLQRDIPAEVHKTDPPISSLTSLDNPEPQVTSLPISDSPAPALPVPAIEQKVIDKPEQEVIKINLEPNETTTQAGIEIVDVPKGVIIRVKRSRAIEHTLSIEWGVTIAGKGELGIKQLVSASIQGEIQRIKGHVLQKSESTEYEITLNGDKHNQYKLVWMDVWLNGTAEIQNISGSLNQPFQFRDRTELKVIPLTNSS